MAVIHRPLFGPTCLEDPMPGALDLDCEQALQEAKALNAALKKDVAPTLSVTDTPGISPPEPQQDYEPLPSYGLAPGRR